MAEATPQFESGSVNSALTRIKNTLNYSLKNNYGIEDEQITENFLRLHGLDKARFDFINNFETLVEKGIADESVDTNANKADVSITGMFVETSLPINKLVGYRYLYRKLKELYGKKRAKYLSGRMYDMSLALADSTNILKNYSYYGNTPIYVKINNEEYYFTLKKLFETFNFSNYDIENDMDVILTKGIKHVDLPHEFSMTVDKNEDILCSEDVEIKVWDDENGFVNISRIIRHKNNRDMILYVTEDGDFAFVTEDHPIILEDGSEIFAGNLEIGTTIKDAVVSNPMPVNFNKICVPEKFAYSLGFMLCELKNPFTRELPKDIFNWKIESIEAFIAGIFDTVGTITEADNKCDIQMKSLAPINGLYELLKLLGVETHKELHGHSSDDLMFGVTFRPTKKIYKWSEKLREIGRSIISNNNAEQNNKTHSNKIAKIIKIHVPNENVESKESLLYKELENVYDITTDTGRFVANGMIQHNCYSINASKLVYEGRPWGTLPSARPHRVDSYLHALVETVHQLSNHLAGALAIGSYFLDIAHVMIYREHKTLSDLKDYEMKDYQNIQISEPIKVEEDGDFITFS